MISNAMANLGWAAARGASPSDSTLAQFRAVATRAPLKVEPFLVKAALAEKAGNLRRAEVLLREARSRNPRSTAALYLQVDVALRENRIADGLSGLAVLARLIPGASVQLIPSLAQFARTPGADQQLAIVLRSNPNLKRPLLMALAADPHNEELVMSLAGSDSRSLDPEAKAWKARLVQAFIQQGDYQRAYRIWQNFTGLHGKSPLLFNGEFRQTPAPPPFDWTYVSGSAGMVEPSGGRLHILYYARESSTLAYQLLLLAPGNYRLTSPVVGNGAAKALTWTILCQGSGKQLLDAPAGQGGLEFSVPGDCRMQTLMLNGEIQDSPQDFDMQVGPVALERISS
jgi:hypothetical protein